MKGLVIISCLILSFNSFAQNNLEITIVDKIWYTNEVYVDGVLEEDSLFIFFEKTGEVLSGNLIEEVMVSNSSRISPSPDSFSIVESGETSPNGRVAANPIIVINDGYEDLEYEVAYYDNDDLILQKPEVITGDYYEDGEDYNFIIEYRLIAVE